MTRKATDEEIALVVRSWASFEVSISRVGRDFFAGHWHGGDYEARGSLDEVFTAAADYIRGLGVSRDPVLDALRHASCGSDCDEG